MLGRDGVPLTTQNIVASVDRNSDEVVDTIAEVIDDPDKDIPAKCVTKEDVARLQELMAHYGNWYATIVNLWGKVRVVAAKRGKGDANIIAARDVLEAQASACWRKYECASRCLTRYQEENRGQHERIF